MNIKNVALEFKSPPVEIKRGLVNNLNRSILIATDDTKNYSVEDLNYQFKEYLSGFPYHYFLDYSGNIFYCRSRAYQNGLFLSDSNSLSNSISILISKEEDKILSTQQESSIVELCALISLQENILPERIFQIPSLMSGAAGVANFDIILSKIKERIKLFDAYRVMGDPSSEIFFKIIIDDSITTFAQLEMISGVPEQFIKRMNPHAILNDGKDKNIVPMSTMFLPRNQLHHLLNASFYSDLAECISDDIAIKNNKNKQRR